MNRNGRLLRFVFSDGTVDDGFDFASDFVDGEFGQRYLVCKLLQGDFFPTVLDPIVDQAASDGLRSRTVQLGGSILNAVVQRDNFFLLDLAGAKLIHDFFNQIHRGDVTGSNGGCFGCVKIDMFQPAQACFTFEVKDTDEFFVALGVASQFVRVKDASEDDGFP